MFNDEQLKVPNVITPYMMPAAFLTVVNELGWITNYHQAFTNTMSSVEQLANGRSGCAGSSRSSYESDGGRLLSRDETLPPPLHQTGAVYACFCFVYFPVSLRVQSRASFDVHQLLTCKSIPILACSSAALLRRQWRERDCLGKRCLKRLKVKLPFGE